MGALPRSIFSAPLSRIGVRPGRRPVDPTHVAALQVSFAEIGQRVPISLILVEPDDPQRDVFTYWLGAGGHRMAAAQGLGWRDLDAILEDDDALGARIAETDENLIRRDLNALERAQALASRLEAWSARYPDRIVQAGDESRPSRGRPKKLPHGAAISGLPTMGFAVDAAKASGLSRDTIERALALHRGLPPSLQARLLTTPLAANEGLLRQLAALGDRDEQAKVADVLIEGRARNLSDARALAAGKAPSKPDQTPVDASLKAFRKVWADATPSGRAAILADLAGNPRLPKGWIVREDRS